MTDPDEPTTDDVLIPTETPHPNHHEHGKTGHHIDDDELAARTAHERDEVGVERDQ